MTLLAIAIGAAIGAPLRYLADRAVQARHESTFPWGTFSVNIVGSLLLGLLAGLSLSDGVMHLLGTGLCGALTTYSTFGYETVRLAQAGARPLALLNALASVVGGLGAAYVGLAFAAAITG